MLTANIDESPDGVFVNLDATVDDADLIWGGDLRAWSASGYTTRLRRRTVEVVTVLTPRSIVAAVKEGYLPEVHPRAWQRWQ